MSITSAIVLYAVIWFMTYLIVIPLRLQTQGDVNKIVPGTHAGAPEHHGLKKKAWITTGVAALLWCIIAGTLLSGLFTVRDIDLFHRMGPGSATGETDG
jgi:predicted secreted protein